MVEEEGTTFEIKISIRPWSQAATDILQAYIHDYLPIGTFEHTDGISAFFETNTDPDQIMTSLQTLWHSELGILNFECTLRPPENWNEIWEQHFEPVVVDGRCRIRAPFHDPDSHVDHDLVIQPKMAFGTGHHETTNLMIQTILQCDLAGSAVLDMGCGTGILAILASKMGARRVMAIDNDPQAIRNAEENIQLNACSNIELIMGDARNIPSVEFKLILANIHLNTIVKDLPHYTRALAMGGTILLSGFQLDDEEIIIDNTIGLHQQCREVRGQWLLLGFTK